MSQELEPAELVNLIGAWIDSKRKSKELELKVASQGSSGVQRIEIVGGLPSLPMRPTEGSVIMPSNDSINGHEFNGQTIDAIAAPGPETKPTEP